MPIKTAEYIFAKYKKYVTKDLVGRVAVKLARTPISVLAVSTVTVHQATGSKEDAGDEGGHKDAVPSRIGN